MKWVFIIIAVLYAGYNYVGKHYQFHDTLVYAKKHPDPRYAPAIDYYVGLVYYQRTQYHKAQEAFTQLLEDYPTAQYMPKALLRLEDSAEYNDDWPTARMAAQKYIEDYPSDKDIDIMKHRLEMLNYRHPG